MKTETKNKVEKQKGFATFESPIGKIYLTCTEQGLAGVSFTKPKGFKEAQSGSQQTKQLMKKVKQQMAEYFSGKRKQWDIPLDLGTDSKGLNGAGSNSASNGTRNSSSFYHKARKQCAKVGYGKTISYGELAKRTKSPRAARAVGTAMATNPIGIVVPCHRVVPSTGAIGKYGGGTSRKEWLQNFEAENM